MNLFTPAEFTENYAQAGVKKASLPVGKMLLLGMLAGFLIAMGGATASTASHAIPNAGLAKMVSGLLFPFGLAMVILTPNAGLAKMVSGLLFPFGLAMVILTGAELFTGNVLINISVFEGKTGFGSMLRNWVWVYIGNFCGAILVAAGMAFLGCLNLSGGGFAVSAIKVAAAKNSIPFLTAVGLGFFCNVLVTIGVLISLGSKDTIGRFIGAYMPVAFFVICGFEHSIANMYYVPAGIFAASNPAYQALAVQAGVNLANVSWGSFVMGNLLPVTLGNILGGLAISFIFWYCYGKK